MAYAGFMIKLGGPTGAELPMDYFRADSYEVENRHTETSNRQDVTGKTHRTVATHTSVRIELETRALDDIRMAALNGLITGAMADTTRRDITIYYYDTETGSYRTANCYMPDVKYTVRKLEENAVIYEPAQLTFIEY